MCYHWITVLRVTWASMLKNSKIFFNHDYNLNLQQQQRGDFDPHLPLLLFVFVLNDHLLLQRTVTTNESTRRSRRNIIPVSITRCCYNSLTTYFSNDCQLSLSERLRLL